MAADNTAKKLSHGHTRPEAANDPRYHDNVIRIKSADRAFLNKPDVTRNTRTSTMPGSPRPKVSNLRPTTDENFNQEYAKKGIQPTGGMEEKSNQPISQSQQRIERSSRVQYTQQTAVRNIRSRRSKKKSLASNITNNAKVIGADTMVLGIGIPGWLFFQLPFATFSVVFLAVVLGLEAIGKTALEVEKSGGTVTEIGGVLIRLIGGAVSSITNYLSKLIGFDLTLINPTNVFLLTYIIVVMYGIFMLFLMYLLYKTSFLKPLGGRGGGLKMGAFIITLVGYSIPVLNLFPWFLVWRKAVQLKPK